MTLKELQREWYRRLRNEGFEDIEYLEIGSDRSCRSLRGGSQSRERPRSWEAQAEYFRMAGWFLYDYRFTKVRDREIWAMHSSGHTIREIAQALNWGSTTVHRVIRALEVGPFERYRAALSVFLVSKVELLVVEA